MANKKKLNVLLILADDVGWFDVGAYHRGMMGGSTPNIDRISGIPALRRGEALDGHASRLHPKVAETFKDFPLWQEPPELNPSAMLAHAMKAAMNGV